MNLTTNNLKILLQCQSLSTGKGGAERVSTELANEMANRGHYVSISYLDYGPPAYRLLESVQLMPYHSLRSFSEAVRSANPDLFFTFYTNHFLIQNYAVVYGSNIPFAMQECTNPTRLCCNNWVTSQKDPNVARWEREIIASAASRIRLTMPGYADTFAPHIRPQIRIYPNPAFPQTTKADPAGEKAHRKTIIIINGFKENKNLITLLEAFARISEVFPEWDVKVIGKAPNATNPQHKAILNFIEMHNLQARVLIVGPSDDLYVQYAAAHIHVIASLSEGCPTVVLEAMSVGLPSIGYDDCPGTNELIRHESNGLLAAGEDRINSLEVALRQLITSPEQRRALGRQALDDSTAFHPKKIYDQWEQLFYETAEYKHNPGRLFDEQKAIDPEKAMHNRRMREKMMQTLKAGELS